MKKEATRKANNSKGSPVARLKDGVRGKYYPQALAGTNLVLIEPDLCAMFPDSDSVNRALRLLAETAQAVSRPKRRGR